MNDVMSKGSNATKQPPNSGEFGRRPSTPLLKGERGFFSLQIFDVGGFSKSLPNSAKRQGLKKSVLGGISGIFGAKKTPAMKKEEIEELPDETLTVITSENGNVNIMQNCESDEKLRKFLHNGEEFPKLLILARKSELTESSGSSADANKLTTLFGHIQRQASGLSLPSNGSTKRESQAETKKSPHVRKRRKCLPQKHTFGGAKGHVAFTLKYCPHSKTRRVNRKEVVSYDQLDKSDRAVMRWAMIKTGNYRMNNNVKLSRDLGGSCSSLPSTPRCRLVSSSSIAEDASIYATPRARVNCSKKFTQSRSKTVSNFEPVKLTERYKDDSASHSCQACSNSRVCLRRKRWMTRTWAELTDMRLSESWTASVPRRIVYNPINDETSDESEIPDPFLTPRDDLSIGSDAWSPSSTSSKTSLLFTQADEGGSSGCGEKAVVQLVHLCDEGKVQMSYDSDLTCYFKKARVSGDTGSQTPRDVLWYRYLSRYDL